MLSTKLIHSSFMWMVGYKQEVDLQLLQVYTKMSWYFDSTKGVYSRCYDNLTNLEAMVMPRYSYSFLSVFAGLALEALTVSTPTVNKAIIITAIAPENNSTTPMLAL